MIRMMSMLQRILFPHSLRYQLLSRILLILAAVLLVIGLFQYVFLERLLYQNKAEGIQRQIQSVPGEIWERVNLPTPRGPGSAFIFFPSSSVAYMNSQGEWSILSSPNSVAPSDSLPQLESIPRLDDSAYQMAHTSPRRAQTPIYEIIDPAGNTQGEQLVVLQAVRSFSGKTGLVQVSTSTGPLKAELYRQLILFLGLAAVALLGSLLAFLPAIRNTLIPLSRMISTVEKIDSGKLNARLPEKDQSREIDRLGHSFNRMLERLESSFQAEKEAKEQMRRFVADASHELRTPLTSIHGFLEVLLRGAATDSEQLYKALKSMHMESVRINKLVADLLQLASLDHALAIQRTEISMAGIIKDLEPQLLLLAQGRKVSLALSTEREPQWLDGDKMKQIILNLFQNAVQHTDSELGHIQIALAHTDNEVELTVTDNGTGIASEHLPHLFDRFYRIEASRARKYGGAGLGLSITRSLVEQHGGTITVESEWGRGSSFHVTFSYNRLRIRT